jgi:hypothetical protein
MPDSSFLEAQQSYEALDTIDLDAAIANLDTSLSSYSTEQGNEARKIAVETAFVPIADYYAKLIRVNEMLQKHINKTAKLIAESETMLTSEERYVNRVYPEESVVSREVMGGFFPQLRPSSLPYIISISVFMASFTIFLILQMNEIKADMTFPFSLPDLVNTLESPAFYQGIMENTVVAIGIFFFVALLLLSIIGFGINYYFRANNTNPSRH